MDDDEYIDSFGLAERFRQARRTKESVVRELGKGTFGRVFYFFDTVTHRRYAVKVFELNEDDGSVSYTVVRELSALGFLKDSTKVIKTYGTNSYEEKGQRIHLIFFEFAEYDLKKYIDEQAATNHFPATEIPSHPSSNFFQSSSIPWNFFHWCQKLWKKTSSKKQEEEKESMDENKEDGSPRWNTQQSRELHLIRMGFVAERLRIKAQELKEDERTVISYAWNRFRTKPLAVTQKQTQLLMKDLIEGIVYMHKNQFVHRDLKPQNLLLVPNKSKKRLTLVIGDLGLAREGNLLRRDKQTPRVATLWYRAPELVIGYPTPRYDYRMDSWSIGCIFPEIATGLPLFPCNNEWELLVRQFQLLGTPSYLEYQKLEEKSTETKHRFPLFPGENLLELFEYALGKNGVDLLQQLLQVVPDKRIPLEEALQHPYFTQSIS